MTQLDISKLREAPFSVLSGELAKTKPVILVIHDPTIEADTQTALDIANTLRGSGIEATTFANFAQGKDLTEMVAGAKDNVDIFIDVVSVDRAKHNEGAHEGMTKIAEDVSIEIPNGTRLFPVVNSSVAIDDVIAVSRHRNYGGGIGVWDESESNRKRLLLGMMFAGPKSRRAEN